jgi:3-phosphoshikimate 1-carboxyvinyltransferase
MDTLVRPANTINAQLSFAGDKSLSHRIVLSALLGPKKLHIKNLASCDDVAISLSIVNRLGVEIKRSPDSLCLNSLPFFGNSSAKPRPNPQLGTASAPLELYCGNSGTTARLLCGILCNLGGHFRLTGDESLSKRPMARVIEPLAQMGFTIHSENDNRLPIIISPPAERSKIKGIDFFNHTGSAQVKSAIELASHMAGVESKITEAQKSRDHTERLLKFLSKNPQQELFIEIPGDISSAAYFGAMAAMYKDGSAQLGGVLLNKTRWGFFQKIREMGARVEVMERGSEWEPWGDVLVRRGELRGVRVRGEEVAGIIDELPLLGVLMGFAAGESAVSGAAELRHKECDRIAAMVAGLRAFGVNCVERADGFEVLGYSPAAGLVTVESFGDHRVAMSLGVMAARSAGGGLIRGGECVGISFVDFWERLADCGVIIE